MDQIKMEKLADLFEQVSRNRYRAMELMKVNGDFIEFMDINTLIQDPEFTADLILNTGYGYPCESLRRVINDNRFLIEVAKHIVSKKPNFLDWVTEHMFSNSKTAYEYLSNYIKMNQLEETRNMSL